MAKTVFYARVSTRDQNPALQVDAARKMGVKNDDIFVEKAAAAVATARSSLRRSLPARKATRWPAGSWTALDAA